MKNKQNKERSTPPYVSFATFSNALASLAEHGVPTQIDRSVLGKFSGSTQAHVIHAFRSLGLTDKDNRSNDILRELASSDEERRKAILGDIIHSKFPEQVKVLPNGTPQQLRSAFDYTKVEPSVKAKCIRFFLNAAREAGLDISPHIKSVRVPVPRKEAPTKRKKRVKKDKKDEKRDEVSEITELKGLTPVPISLGPNKVWYVHVDEQYTKDDVDRFTQIIGIVLGGNK